MKQRPSTMPSLRRGISVTKESDISDNQWPVTTVSSYKIVLKEVAGTPEDQMNMKMVRLCETRAKLGHLILAFKNARALWKDDEKVHGRLMVLEDELEVMLKDYPLELRNRTVPVAFAAEDSKTKVAIGSVPGAP